MVLYKSQKYNEALPFYLRAYEANPASEVAAGNLAWNYVDLGMYDRAYELLLSIKSDRDDWKRSMGRLLLYKGDYWVANEILAGVP